MHSSPFIIASRIFAPEIAAAAFRLKALSQALGKSQAVQVLTGKLPAEVSDIDIPGVDIRRFPVKRDKDGFVRGLLEYMSYDIPLFFRLLFAGNFSIVVSEPPPTTGLIVRLACALRKRPYVYYAADVWTDAARGLAPDFVISAISFLERRVLSGASGVIAVNDGVAQRVRELGGKNVASIPNGIDTQTFTPQVPDLTEAEKQKMGITGKYFIYAGTVSEWQKAAIFAHALEKEPKLSDYQILYLCQGSDLPEIKAAAERLPGRVVISPLVPAHEAARWQKGAEASLVSIKPGQGYDFAYPTKVYAAWACATPIVYAGVGSVVSDVQNFDLGECATDFDPQTVAQAMLRVVRLTDAENRKRIREWVVNNRSMSATGKAAAEFVKSCVQSAKS